MTTVYAPLQPSLGPYTPTPGDVGFSHGAGFVDWCIRFAEKRRYGRDAPEAHWNHMFMVTGMAGGIIEAQGRGVVGAVLGEYDEIEHAIYRPPYTAPDDCTTAVEVMRRAVGAQYGYLTIACEGLAFLTQTRLRFGLAGQHICSGIVSHALELGGVDMGDEAEWNSPADAFKVVRSGKWERVR